MWNATKLLRTSSQDIVKLRANQRGNAVVEVSLLAPWILFLFVGMFDMGMYTYSMIAVENAVRVAAEYTSQNASVAGDASGACTRALAEMSMLPNVGSTCGTTVVVNATKLDSTTTPASLDGQTATSVQVTYTGNQLIPIPGVLMGSLNLTRTLQVRVKP